MSIPLNIAEGYSKQESAAEFGRFLRMSIGSANEVLVLLEFAKDFGYMSKAESERLNKTYTEICKMLHGLQKSRAPRASSYS